MNYLILAHDGTDAGAAERRTAARAAHLALFKEMLERGVFQYGTAILDKTGKMVGSMIVCNFRSRAELESQWLSREPYVLGDVWREVEILRTQVPPCLATGPAR